MLKDLVLKSRSFRSFDKSRKITEEEILALIDLTRSCPSARNLQPLKYRYCVSEEDISRIFPLTSFAGALKPLVLPPRQHEPTAYIVICSDNEICPKDSNRFLLVDVGIAAQTIMLGATEMGLGGCMLGAFKAEEVSEALCIDEKYTPILILALGKPDEAVVLKDASQIDVPYYRDENSTHFVPKRKLEDIVL